MTPKAQALNDYYTRQLAMVERFKRERGEEETTRQNTKGEWVPCRWNDLATQAIGFYTTFLHTLESGTYQWAYALNKEWTHAIREGSMFSKA